jgi:hypothetical protein
MNTATITAPLHPPSRWTTASAYAKRTILQFARTPQLLVSRRSPR